MDPQEPTPGEDSAYDAGYTCGKDEGRDALGEDYTRALDDVVGILAAYDLAEGHGVPDAPDELPAYAEQLALDLARRLGPPAHMEMVPERLRSLVVHPPRDAWRALYREAASRYAMEARLNRGQALPSTAAELDSLTVIGAALGVTPEEVAALAEQALRAVAA